MTKRNLSAAMFLLGFLLSPRLYSQTEQPDERYSEASLAASDAQTKRIRKELRHLKNHDWAGEYYFGDGLGSNISLALAPKSGFVFTSQSDITLSDLNYGKVTFTNGTVKLLFKYPNKREGPDQMAPELLPVHWGERHYLIGADGIVEFTNAINAGTEPSYQGRSYYFLLRRGDEKKPVAGQPNLPKEFLSYILAEPIKARISSVEQTRVEHCCRITSITINVGSADGLKQGMEFYVHSQPKVSETATVTDVSEHSARAVIKQWDPTDPVPSAGWELSTKL